MHDFAGLRGRNKGWALVALDLGVDTTTPTGELVANVMASVVQWELLVIGQRTRDALAAKKAQGTRLGRPVELPDGVRQCVAEVRGDGMSQRAIAAVLNDEGVPTARGDRCHSDPLGRAQRRTGSLTRTALEDGPYRAAWGRATMVNRARPCPLVTKAVDAVRAA